MWDKSDFPCVYLDVKNWESNVAHIEPRAGSKFFRNKLHSVK